MSYCKNICILIVWKLVSLLNQQMNSFLSRVICIRPLKLKKKNKSIIRID